MTVFLPMTTLSNVLRFSWGKNPLHQINILYALYEKKCGLGPAGPGGKGPAWSRSGRTGKFPVRCTSKKYPWKNNTCLSVRPSVHQLVRGISGRRSVLIQKMNRSKVVPNSPRVFPRNRCRPPPMPPNPQKGGYFPRILTFEYLRRYHIFWHSIGKKFTWYLICNSYCEGQSSPALLGRAQARVPRPYKEVRISKIKDFEMEQRA